MAFVPNKETEFGSSIYQFEKTIHGSEIISKLVYLLAIAISKYLHLNVLNRESTIIDQLGSQVSFTLNSKGSCEGIVEVTNCWWVTKDYCGKEMVFYEIIISETKMWGKISDRNVQELIVTDSQDMIPTVTKWSC